MAHGAEEITKVHWGINWGRGLATTDYVTLYKPHDSGV